MVSANEISAWGEGYCMHCGSIQEITQGDTIKSVTVNLAHAPKSSTLDLGYTTISTEKGRTVRCGIWINQDKNNILNNRPNYLSKETFNTNDIKMFESLEPGAEEPFREVTFTFNDDKGVTINSANSVYIGLYSVTDNASSTSLCFKKTPYGTLYYTNVNDDEFSSTYGAMWMEVVKDTPSHNKKPPLQITQVEYRTLSKVRQKSSNEVSISEPRTCYPLPSEDSNIISGEGKQWNADYDIKEGCLRDVKFIASGQSFISASNNRTQTRPFWVHSRSRIKITFAALTDKYEDTYGALIRSTITYQVNQGKKRKVTFTEKIQRNPDYVEGKGSTQPKYLPNTLIICPRDEGIGDNEPMDITIHRTTIATNGRKQQESEKIQLRFYTFASPEVNIAYPKKLEGNNYILWANEVMNDPYSESKGASVPVCAALNVLLTKDGGDDSGFPMFTRVHIAEYKGTYGSNGNFPTPSNEEIYNGTASNRITATWTGIIADDGSLIQFSGLQPEGDVWHTVTEDELDYVSELVLNSNVGVDNGRYFFTNAKGERITVKTDNSSPYGTKKEWYFDDSRYRIWHDDGKYDKVTFTQDFREINGEKREYNYVKWDGSTASKVALCFADPNRYGHIIEMGHKNAGNTWYTGEIDRRMYFRAERKYLIKVRRFHSVVAGVLGICQDDTSSSSYARYEDAFQHYSGGNYYYIGNNSYDVGMNASFGSDSYYGARTGVGGNTQLNYSWDIWTQTANGYPLDDSVSWLTENNKMSKSGAGPIRESSEYVRHVWVGPDDGSSGLSGNDSRIDEVYPGFSKSDAIIIDCVNGMSTNSNIITPRPASQEIGADHWITFAYRHLNKDGRGVEVYKYNKDTNSTDIGFGKTWGGSDNTVTRICKMYQTLLDKCLQVASSMKKQAEGASTCDEKECGENQITKTELEIYIDHQGHSEYPTPPAPNGEVTGNKTAPYNLHKIYSDSNYSGYERLVPVGNPLASNGDASKVAGGAVTNISNDHFLYDWYNGGVYNAAGKKSVNFTTFNHIIQEAGGKKSVLGNSYEWVPVINNTTNSGTKNIKTCHTTSEVPLTNWGDALSKDVIGTYGIIPDLDHVVSDVESYQTWLSSSNKSIYKEYGRPDGSLYTTIGDKDASSNDADWSFTGHSAETYGQPSQQYFSDSAENPSNSSSNTGPYQHNPGKLFLRVPPSQDCENGEPTDRIALPNRKDAEYPLVRSSHYLYFKSYIHGKFIIKLRYTYEKHEPEYDEETNEYTDCDTSPATFYKDSNAVSQDAEGWNLYNPIPSNWGMTVTGLDNKSYSNVLCVYGEDNKGLGRCLSADDSSAVWQDKKGIHNINDSQLKLDGGVEIPLRVRYTPLLQPIITHDSNIIENNKVSPVTSRTSNIISLSNNKVTSSSDVDDDMKGQNKFFVNISYGMYRSAMKGCYLSQHVKTHLKDVLSGNASNDTTFVTLSDHNMLQQTTLNSTVLPIKQRIGNDADKAKNTITVTSKWSDYNSDTYPAVGICNAFMVLLVPNGAVSSYQNLGANFYANRKAIENWGKGNAKAVIVADMAKTKSYIYNKNVSDVSDTIDHKLRTLFNCEFNYDNLLHKKNKAVITSVSTKDSLYSQVANRSNLLKVKTWYDLVVVPIFTDMEGFGSEESKRFSGQQYNFRYQENSAGKILHTDDEKGSSTIFGSNSSEKTVPTRFYGSSPLVIRKFLQIASDTHSGGGGGDDDDNVILDAPFATESCIMFPNVNTRLYDTEDGIIRECPGFWLNNTFRLICRGPHYRDQATIERYIKSNKAISARETSLEEATQDVLTGAEQCKDFEVSDCMIHFGKYNDYVMVYDEVSESFTRDSYRFSDESFQELLSEKAMDREWLNARGIYTMRTNGNAFSKCTPEAKKSGDVRETIKGGSLDSTGEYYSDRFFEFNPSMVNVHTPYPEGYYIQIRFLNAEYGDTSQGGQWTEWTGGVVGGGTIANNGGEATGNFDCKDVSLQYYVPTRNYNEIFTAFRHHVKESTPGSNLTTGSEEVSSVYGDSIVKGSGSESPNTIALQTNVVSAPYFIVGTGNYYNQKGEDVMTAAVVPDIENDYPHPSQLLFNADGTYPSSISPTQGISKEVIDRHQTYWEMNYVDYVIRNMAKLYQSDWSEAMVNLVDTKVTPEDVGWTKAKALAYDYPTWTSREWDVDLSHLKTQLTEDGKVIAAKAPNGTRDANSPYNVNRYFRKNICSQDFDSLLNVLKHMVSFIRNQKFTGIPDDPTALEFREIDPRDDNLNATGFSVLPVSEGALDFTKLNQTRMVIGHSLNINDADKTSPENNDYFKRVDSNYMQQLLTAVYTKIIVDAIPSDTEF